MATAISRKSIVDITTPFRSKSLPLAATIVTIAVLLYLSLLWLTLSLSNNLLRLLASLALGVVITRLFIIGHDCCHGAFFSSQTLNKAIGRAVFLPSLTPYSLWEIGHNVLHHSFPNLNMTFSLPMSALLHNIMEHNAHHSDVNVPLYALPKAQTTLEESVGEDVVVQKWSLEDFRECLRVCKLYDFSGHYWLDFDGNVTSQTQPR